MQNSPTGMPSNGVAVSVGCVNLFDDISDDFETAKAWTDSVAPLAATGGATAPASTRPTTKGNPGGYMEMQHVLPGNSSISVHHILQQPYDPGIMGNAITRIEYSEDEIEMNAPFTGAAIGTTFLVKQGNTVLLRIINPPSGAFKDTTWVTSPNVDPHSGGSTRHQSVWRRTDLNFGFQRGNTNNSGPQITTTHGIDNFKVRLCR